MDNELNQETNHASWGSIPIIHQGLELSIEQIYA